MKAVKFEGISFNADWAMSMSEGEFVANKSNTVFFTHLDRAAFEDKLREAYRAIAKAIGKELHIPEIPQSADPSQEQPN
jgi:hypothetical protein